MARRTVTASSCTATSLAVGNMALVVSAVEVDAIPATIGVDDISKVQVTGYERPEGCLVTHVGKMMV